MITCEGVCPTQFSKKRTTAGYLAGPEACLAQRQAGQVLCPSADHPGESLWMVLLQGEQQEQRQEVELLVGKLALLPLFQPLVEMETAKMNVSSNAISPSFIQTCNPLNTAGQNFHFYFILASTLPLTLLLHIIMDAMSLVQRNFVEQTQIMFL